MWWAVGSQCDSVSFDSPATSAKQQTFQYYCRSSTTPRSRRHTLSPLSPRFSQSGALRSASAACCRCSAAVARQRPPNGFQRLLPHPSSTTCMRQFHPVLLQPLSLLAAVGEAAHPARRLPRPPASFLPFLKWVPLRSFFSSNLPCPKISRPSSR